MRIGTLSVLIIALAACGSEPPPPPRASVMDAQTQAIKQAKQVEQQAAERKRKLDEQLDGDGS